MKGTAVAVKRRLSTRKAFLFDVDGTLVDTVRMISATDGGGEPGQAIKQLHGQMDESFVTMQITGT